MDEPKSPDLLEPLEGRPGICSLTFLGRRFGGSGARRRVRGSGNGNLDMVDGELLTEDNRRLLTEDNRTIRTEHS